MSIQHTTLTFLGTGTSQGVPIIGCQCEVCTSKDKRDNRLRTSAMVEIGDKRFIIDAGPDFRQQLLREGVTDLTAILLTHCHKDHTGGIDDVRAINFIHYPVIRTVDIYCTPRTAKVVRKDYDYAFAEDKYRGVPCISLHEINPQLPLNIEGVEIIPFLGQHSIFEVVGYRFGDLAYMTDFKKISDAELEKIVGVKVLVIGALCWYPHDSHFDVAEAMAISKRVGAERTYFIHMSHKIGLYEKAQKLLPDSFFFAYDGLKIEI